MNIILSRLFLYALLIILSFYMQKKRGKHNVLKNRCDHAVDDFFVEDYLKEKMKKDLGLVRMY